MAYENTGAASRPSFDNRRRYDDNYHRGPRPAHSGYPRQDFQPARPIQPVVVAKPALDPQSRDLIRFKDHYYTVEMLLAQSKIGPRIEVLAEELHEKFDQLANPSRVFSEKLINNEPVFFRHEGKYIVLLGRQAALQWMEKPKAKLVGRLISTPALKRCLID